MSQRRGGPRLLITDRESAVVLERARVHVDGDRIVYYSADDEMRRVYNLPHANLAVLFLGQGTSITQDAARLLADEGVHLAFTGSGGSPLHMGALTTYHSTKYFREMLPIYLDPVRSLSAAKAVMLARVDCMKSLGIDHARRWMGERDCSALVNICSKLAASLVTVSSIHELLGHEGVFSKECYQYFARCADRGGKGAARVKPFARVAGGAVGQEPFAVVNRLIDHGNYLAYGMAGAALWTLGIPPHLAVFHGKTRAGGLVFDLADAFKDAYVLPAAFAYLTKRRDADPESAFRARVIGAFDDERVLVRAIGVMDAMIAAGVAVDTVS